MTALLRIAICGAGVAGLAAAAFLHRDGHHIELLERFDAPRPLGAGLLLQPTGLACLSLLGLEEGTIALGARVLGIQGATSSGRRVLDMRYHELRPGYFGLGIHRAALFSVLSEEVRRLGIAITTSAEAMRIETHATRRTVVIDGQGRHHGPYDLVIDATGMRSALRRQLPEKVSERPFRYGALWAALPMPPGWTDRDILQQRYAGASVMIGMLPIGRLPDDPTPLAAFFWSLPADCHPRWQDEGLTAWKRRVATLWPQMDPVLAAIRRPDDLAFASYADIVMRHPVDERSGLVVLGDAAHGTSPQLGQGANLALIDAMTLAASLRATSTVADGLTTFAEARRRHVRFYQWASRWLTPFFQSDSRFAGALRDATFGIACRLPVTRSQSLKTLAGVKTGLFSDFDPDQWRQR